MAKIPPAPDVEVVRTLATLTERLDNTRKELDSFREAQQTLGGDVAKWDKQLALLGQQFDELKRNSEESGKRRWGLLQGFLLAVAGSALTLITQYLVMRFKRP